MLCGDWVSTRHSLFVTHAKFMSIRIILLLKILLSNLGIQTGSILRSTGALVGLGFSSSGFVLG